MGNGFFQSVRALLRLKPAQKLNRDYLISLLCAVLLAFLVGAGIMLLCGFDPIQCYGALFEGALGKPRAIGNTLAKATTLALCGLAMSVAAKAGIFNVGGEGQLFMGALAAAVVGAQVKGVPAWVVVILALLAASGFTNLYLTKHLFRHIRKPLDILVSGVKRMQEGNLDAPIGYVVPDEFKPACDAVDEMAARLKTSLEAQSRQQQQKQELIAGMSHDLKSPLTSIRAYTEGLLDGVAKDEQTQARYLQTIYAKETELETLVNRLFSFAKLDLSEAPAKPEALEISGTFAEIAAGFEAEGLDVRLDDLPDETVMADRELLSRCMSNLLDNSRKYGASHVVISADISGDTVSISVSDDGPGVEASQLEKIFELGYRTDSARQIRS